LNLVTRESALFGERTGACRGFESLGFRRVTPGEHHGSPIVVRGARRRPRIYVSGCFSISIRRKPLVVQIAARSLKRINSIAILAAARIPVQMEFSLGTGIYLYPNVWEHVQNTTNLGDHPYELCQMLGFVIVGVSLVF
jgi:hypothetical protein